MKAPERKTNSSISEGRRPLGSVDPRRLLAMRGHSQVVRRSWEEAEKKANNPRESNKHSAAPVFGLQPGTMREAVTKFLDNKAQEGHGKAWNQMLRRELTDFANWCAVKLVTPENVNVITLEEYRKTWKGAPSMRLHRQARLSVFAKYCRDRNWMRQNFVGKMSKIKAPKSPRLRLSREEFDRTIAAVEHYARSHNASWRC